MGLPGGSPAPGAIEVERLALLAVSARGIVGAIASELPALVGHAARGVPVALAPPPDGEVGHGVRESLLRGALVVQRGLVVGHGVQSVKDDPDVRGGHPILQDRRGVEVVGGGPAFQGAEGDPGGVGARRALSEVRVGAEGLLLVRLADHQAVRASVDLAALRRVKLERLPGASVVHGLMDGDRVGLPAAELQTDVGEFVLLAQGEREGDVALRREGFDRGRVPTSQVVGVVQIGQKLRGVRSPGIGGVTDVTFTRYLPFLFLRQAIPGRGVSASAGGLHVPPEGGIDEVRDAFLGTRARFVVTRVGGIVLGLEHLQIPS